MVSPLGIFGETSDRITQRRAICFNIILSIRIWNGVGINNWGLKRYRGYDTYVDYNEQREYQRGSLLGYSHPSGPRVSLVAPSMLCGNVQFHQLECLECLPDGFGEEGLYHVVDVVHGDPVKSEGVRGDDIEHHITGSLMPEFKRLMVSFFWELSLGMCTFRNIISWVLDFFKGKLSTFTIMSLGSRSASLPMLAKKCIFSDNSTSSF